MGGTVTSTGAGLVLQHGIVAVLTGARFVWEASREMVRQSGVTRHLFWV